MPKAVEWLTATGSIGRPALARRLGRSAGGGLGPAPDSDNVMSAHLRTSVRRLPDPETVAALLSSGALDELF